MTIDQMISNVRGRLGQLRAQRPTDKQILLNLSSQIQTFINEANLSQHTWATGEITLNVTPGQEDYPIPLNSNFGKPLMVRTVFPQNPAHIERTVDFYELQDLNFDWNLPLNFGNTFYNLDGSPHTAMRMAFFRKSGQDQVYVRVLPIPQLPATYQILYQIGEYGSTVPLNETPILPQHHQLIELRCTQAILPLCEWNTDEGYNAEKRKEFATALTPDLARADKNFRDYLASTTVSRRLSYRVPAFSID